jgi:hypothetical protein
MISGQRWGNIWRSLHLPVTVTSKNLPTMA